MPRIGVGNGVGGGDVGAVGDCDGAAKSTVGSGVGTAGEAVGSFVEGIHKDLTFNCFLASLHGS